MNKICSYERKFEGIYPKNVDPTNFINSGITKGLGLWDGQTRKQAMTKKIAFSTLDHYIPIIVYPTKQY